MTHNDLRTYIALTKWDGPVACVNVTENVEFLQSTCYHFTVTKTFVTVSVKQEEYDWVTRCTFSADFKEINTRARFVYNRDRAAVTEKRLGYLEPWRDIFPNTYGIPDRHLRNDA